MYLTFDVGTTALKTALYNTEGRRLHRIIKEYRIESPSEGCYEFNPELYWQYLLEGFKELLKRSDVNPSEIKSISGCSQGETVIFLDRDNTPLRPALVWLDKRASREVEILQNIFEEETLYRTTGLSEMDTTWSAPKILWVKNNEKNCYERIDKVMLIEDYLVYRLTGQFVATPSLWSSSALFDIRTKQYWSDMVDYLGVSEKLPKIVPEGSIVGNPIGSVCDLLGLNRKTVVVKGSMDQTLGILGGGNIVPGIVTETTGTALAVVSIVEEVSFEKSVKIPFQPHVIDDKYILLPFAQTAGIVYKWFRDEFLDTIDYEEYNNLASKVPPGADGLLLLPFLAGAVYPENDPYAKGVLYGLTLKHGKAHFIRAIMESIGYLLNKILGVMEDYGVVIEEIRSMGGGARSDEWLQIKADICGNSIIRMREEEAPSLGAAILSAVKIGDYPHFQDAVSKMVNTGKVFSPESQNAHVYTKGYELYCSLIELMKPVFKKY